MAGREGGGEPVILLRLLDDASIGDGGKFGLLLGELARHLVAAFSHLHTFHP